MKKHLIISLVLFAVITSLSLIANFIRWDETPLRQTVYAFPLLVIVALFQIPFYWFISFWIGGASSINYELLSRIMPFGTGFFYAASYYFIVFLSKKQKNPTRIKRIFLALGIVGVSCIVTIISFTHQRHHPVAVGNVCEKTTENPSGLCYEDLPSAGFPFSYVYDSNGSSVIGRLGPEDRFKGGYFVLDILFYSSIFFLITFIRKRFFPASKSAHIS